MVPSVDLEQGTNGDLYEDVQHSNVDDGYSRDSNKCVSQYGGTTEIYTPASGYGRKPVFQPSAYDSSKQSFFLLNRMPTSSEAELLTSKVDNLEV